MAKSRLAVHIVPRLPRKSGGNQGTPEGRQGVHPTPWQCTLSHACHAKAAETKGHRRDARAYIRPLGSALCPTPATQKRRRPEGHRRDTGGTPEGHRGVHPTPWQCTLSHAYHAKEAETKGHRRDARAYIRPLGSAHCPTPATQKRRRPRDTGGTPEGRQGVHPTPWQCTLSHACHAKAAETQGVHPTTWQCTLSHACHAKAAETKGHRRDTGGTSGRTSDPLAVHIVPRLPRKSGGDQGTPEGHRRDARAYIRPLGSAHCPTPATQKRRRPRDTGGTPGRTSDPLAVHIVPRLPRKSDGDQGTPEGHRRDARAYIRPLGSAHCPTPATQKRRRPRNTGGTPEGRQGVHPTPWQCTLSHACHAKAAETKGHRRDTRARPLGSAHCPTPATQKRRRPRDTGGTPGRTSDPLAVHVVPRLPRKSGGDQGTPERHRRDARAYIRPLGSAHCPTPATQKRRRPRDTGGTPEGHRRDTGGTPEGHRGVHPTPWQCTLSHACHAKEAETKGHRRDTGGTPEGHRRDARAYIRPLGSAHCPTPATQKRRRSSQGVHPTLGSE